MEFVEIIEIYSWIIAIILLLFIIEIAIFYEKTIKKKTNFYYFVIPILLITSTILRVNDQFNFNHELIEFIGAFGSLILTIRLYNMMTGIK